MTTQVYQRGDDGGGTFSSPQQDGQATSKRRHRITKKILWLIQLPFVLWYSVWTFPDDYYDGGRDLVDTICYMTLKVVWILVTLLIVWLTICPFFGF